MLVIMSGLPATGKTTISRTLARRLDAVHLRIDTIEQAIVRAGVIEHPIGPAGYQVAYALAEDHLRQGLRVVADSVNPLPVTRDAWRAVGETAGVHVVEVEVVCSDPAEHRSRAVGRAADIPDLPLPDWPAITTRDHRPWDREHVICDTAGRTVADCVTELEHVLRCGTTDVDTTDVDTTDVSTTDGSTTDSGTGHGGTTRTGAAADTGRLPLDRQVENLRDILVRNQVLTAALDRAAELALPGWYLTAGCLFQTVWNVLTGRPPTTGIKDYDLVYFDGTDLSAETESAAAEAARRAFTGLPATLDVHNEARVHLWYERKHSVPCPPYTSTEAAIGTFPATACCLGVRIDPAGAWRIHAPYGLSDLFDLVVRPNPVLATRSVYAAKTDRWRRQWPELTVLPWPNATMVGGGSAHPR